VAFLLLLVLVLPFFFMEFISLTFLTVLQLE